MSVVSRNLAALIVIAIVVLAAWIIQDDPSPLLNRELSPGSLADHNGVRSARVDDQLPPAVLTSPLANTATEQRQSVEAQVKEAKASEVHGNLLRGYHATQEVSRPVQEELPVALRVLADQAGLLVDVYVQGGRRATGIGKVRTDEFGEARVTVHQSGPLRIELRGSSGRVLGKTESYLDYPRGVESIVRIPSSAGGLKLYLPSGSSVDPGEAMQYILSSDETGDEIALSETVHGDKPNVERRGVRSTSQSLEIKELPAVQYAVKALRMIRRDNGRWYPTGDRWLGVAEVRAGETTVCQLN